ncbi:MAG TPA: T9SS type A sorting domain-containing protein, partial [Bacteroidales bacterium]|nr:T9SS type A sorting domain-containing protein [Bacteroidales bacterium]
AIDIDTTALVNITCNGLNNGSVDITVTGGTSPYTYSWASADGLGLVAADEDQSGLSAGLYQLTVSDANLCEATATFTISEPTDIIIEQTLVNNITCNGLTDGSINITVTGGTVASSYVYNWETTDGSGLNATEQDQSGLSAGIYNVTVTDDNSCEGTSSVTITEPGAITIDSENATNATAQTASDGSVQVTASGGTGALQYTINPGGTSNETGTFGNLSPGDYTVSVTDQNSCGPVVSSSLTVGFPDAIEIIAKNENIKIYPNPTSSKITLEINNNIYNEYTIQIVNISGQILSSENIISENSIKKEFDISEYAKGLYFIKIFTEKEYFQEKIILQ